MCKIDSGEKQRRKGSIWCVTVDPKDAYFLWALQAHGKRLNEASSHGMRV